MKSCKQCGNACKNESVLESCGQFCSINCAQIDYEDKCLQDELRSSNPSMEGLEEAVMRMI